MGTTIKVNLVFDEPFWRADGLNGSVVSTAGPIKVAYDNSPPDGKPGVLVGFCEGTDGSDLYDASKKRRKAAILESFVRYFGEPVRRPRRYLELVWAAERFTRGAYGSYNPPGTLTSIGHIAGRPFGRVHFAASDLSREWTGYMDGAIRSGEAAAGEIAGAIA
jgi:monoamine oxidase